MQDININMMDGFETMSRILCVYNNNIQLGNIINGCNSDKLMFTKVRHIYIYI